MDLPLGEMCTLQGREVLIWAKASKDPCLVDGRPTRTPALHTVLLTEAVLRGARRTTEGRTTLLKTLDRAGRHPLAAALSWEWAFVDVASPEGSGSMGVSVLDS